MFLRPHTTAAHHATTLLQAGACSSWRTGSEPLRLMGGIARKMEPKDVSGLGGAQEVAFGLPSRRQVRLLQYNGECRLSCRGRRYHTRPRVSPLFINPTAVCSGIAAAVAGSSVRLPTAHAHWGVFVVRTSLLLWELMQACDLTVVHIGEMRSDWVRRTGNVQ